MALTTLPDELLLAITSSITDECDLNALVRTNRRLYEALDKELYRFNVEENNSSALLWASLHGHDGSVRKLLRLNADVNACTKMRKTSVPPAISLENASIVTRNLEQEIAEGRAHLISSPLVYAAAMNHTAIMRLLIDAGAEVHRRRGCHRIPIMVAADQGRVDALEMLLDAGADIEAHGANCNTPLSLAASKGHLPAVETLLARGAAVNALRRNRTALARAAQIGHYGTVRALLDAGADVASQDHSDRTAITWAMEGDHDDVVALLLDRSNPDLEAASSNGFTLLSWAANAVAPRCATLLLDRGADLTAPVPPPLWLAVAGRNRSGIRDEKTRIITTIKLLLARGARADLVHATDGHAHPLIVDAALGDRATEAAVLLEQAGVDPNSASKDGTTALFAAVSRGQEGAVYTLLQHGADPNQPRHPRGDTPLGEAVRSGIMLIVRYLLEGGATPRASDLRASLHGVARSGAPMMWDTHGDAYDITCLLIEHGADPTRDLPDGGGGLLLAVASSGYEYIVSKILESQPSLANHSTPNGKTPLFLAVREGNPDTARTLLAHGADPNHVQGGRPLLEWAKEHDDEDGASLVQMLVEHGGRCDEVKGLDRVERMIEAQESIYAGIAEMGL